MDRLCIRQTGLCLTAGIALAACAGLPATSAPALSCDQIATEKDHALAALDALFPKLQKESHHSIAYWINVLFPAGQPVPASEPRRAAVLALTSNYDRLIAMSQAQDCSPPLPSLQLELTTRAYVANRHLFDRAAHPVRRVGAAVHRASGEK